jgi:hypothetical protein
MSGTCRIASLKHSFTRQAGFLTRLDLKAPDAAAGGAGSSHRRCGHPCLNAPEAASDADDARDCSPEIR